MRIEDLELAQKGMREKYAYCCFADEPVTPTDIQR
jgi:hypothetical protein